MVAWHRLGPDKARMGLEVAVVECSRPDIVVEDMVRNTVEVPQGSIRPAVAVVAAG